MGKRGTLIYCRWESQRDRDHWEDQNVGEDNIRGIILKYTLLRTKHDMKVFVDVN
jgi:hypothetical protein